jgi:hypothetical protein
MKWDAELTTPVTTATRVCWAMYDVLVSFVKMIGLHTLCVTDLVSFSRN